MFSEHYGIHHRSYSDSGTRYEYQDLSEPMRDRISVRAFGGHSTRNINSICVVPNTLKE